ncbi:uncharacterized protein OCT59_004848 [Rhizophagus irregularis]|uniref:Uncharacterized protein n=1 Tax=Rhizophagus irregularis TaxID=588596 RepID=A0A915YYZ6_9GLOM|nr:hypothetical protein OCT59_004848 [Rhizophagus irregularis]GBC21788.2 hypothetical protein GLOIN_2v1786804 [Rhizophagus irregularis DAOM 181602=DAOM 197198]CAB4493999.1 unnamed protein product [Rhizophagus irregularis]CAB5353859.1 unnamed protein product [Rhizophagus irregularis]
MPVQLSTILIFQNIGRKHQKNKPCYVPKLEEGQVLSIANSKFAIGPVDNQIDAQLRKMPWSSTSSSSSPHMIATRAAIHKKIEQSAPISTLIVTEEIQGREEQEESASILITPATIPATTPPSKKRVGHAKV